MRLLGVFSCGLRMLLSFRRMLVALLMVALAVVLGGGAMRLGRVLMVLGCFRVLLVGHVVSLCGLFPLHKHDMCRKVPGCREASVCQG